MFSAVATQALGTSQEVDRRTKLENGPKNKEKKKSKCCWYYFYFINYVGYGLSLNILKFKCLKNPLSLLQLQLKKLFSWLKFSDPTLDLIHSTHSQNLKDSQIHCSQMIVWRDSTIWLSIILISTAIEMRFSFVTNS